MYSKKFECQHCVCHSVRNAFDKKDVKLLFKVTYILYSYCIGGDNTTFGQGLANRVKSLSLVFNDCQNFFLESLEYVMLLMAFFRKLKYLNKYVFVFLIITTVTCTM